MDTPKEDGGATNEPNRPKAGQHIQGDAGVSMAAVSDLQAGGLSERSGELRSHGDGAGPSSPSGPRDPYADQAAIAPPVAEIARKLGYEVTPLFASPVPSSERDDIIEMAERDLTTIRDALDYALLGLHQDDDLRPVLAPALRTADQCLRSLKSQPAQEAE